MPSGNMIALGAFALIGPNAVDRYPGKTNCGYYDFLKFERTAQNDPDWVSTTNHD